MTQGRRSFSIFGIDLNRTKQHKPIDTEKINLSTIMENNGGHQEATIGCTLPIKSILTSNKLIKDLVSVTQRSKLSSEFYVNNDGNLSTNPSLIMRRNTFDTFKSQKQQTISENERICFTKSSPIEIVSNRQICHNDEINCCHYKNSCKINQSDKTSGISLLFLTSWQKCIESNLNSTGKSSASSLSSLSSQISLSPPLSSIAVHFPKFATDAINSKIEGEYEVRSKISTNKLACKFGTSANRRRVSAKEMAQITNNIDNTLTKNYKKDDHSREDKIISIKKVSRKCLTNNKCEENPILASNVKQNNCRKKAHSISTDSAYHPLDNHCNNFVLTSTMRPRTSTISSTLSTIEPNSSNESYFRDEFSMHEHCKRSNEFHVQGNTQAYLLSLLAPPSSRIFIFDPISQSESIYDAY